MRILIALAALAAPACSQPSAPAAPAADPQAAAPAAPAASLTRGGEYTAASNSATSITGDLMVTDAGIHFALAQDYFTEAAGSAPASADFAAGGGSWASMLAFSGDATIEIRRVISQNVGAAARNGGLCGTDAVTFVALVSAPDTAGAPMLRVAAFKGANPPGPAGALTDLCGVFNYTPET